MYTVKSINHPNGERYKRFSGSITADSGETFWYEYGEYPVPAADPDDSDELVFAVKVRRVLNKETGHAKTLDTVTAVHLLKEAGEWDEEHISYMKSKYAGLAGLEILEA